MKKTDNLFLVTILFFIVSTINILFGLIALLCFITPFIINYLSKSNIWCRKYCPRASFLTVVLSKISLGLKLPKWLTGKVFKQIMIYYFLINLFFAVLSTIMVSIGKVDPIDYVRVLIVFKAPFKLPQMIVYSVPRGLLHFSYRIYSIMFTSTILGLITGLIFKPRTWCTICPMNQLLRAVQTKK